MNFEEIKKKLLKEYQINKNLVQSTNRPAQLSKVMVGGKKKKKGVKVTKPNYQAVKTQSVYMHEEKNMFEKKRHSYQPKSSLKENAVFKQPFTRASKKSKGNYKDFVGYAGLLKQERGQAWN